MNRLPNTRSVNKFITPRQREATLIIAGWKLYVLDDGVASPEINTGAPAVAPMETRC